MKRASVIVQVENDTGSTIGYTCESVHVNFNGTVTLFSSCTPLTVAQERVKDIRYDANGAGFCPWCDQSVEHFSRLT
jgi:hypothetical protein